MKEIQLGFFYAEKVRILEKRVGMIPTCISVSLLKAKKVTMKLIHVVMNILAFMCC